jgi:hypothetical protein
MKFKALAIAALATSVSLSATHPSLAQTYSSAINTSNISANDQVFIRNYKSLIVQIVKEPRSRQILLYSVQNNPVVSINTAKVVCSSLRSGISMNEISRIQVETIINQGGSSQEQQTGAKNFGIINSLAPMHYCPEFQGS